MIDLYNPHAIAKTKDLTLVVLPRGREMPHPMRLVFLAACFYLLQCRVDSISFFTPPVGYHKCFFTTCHLRWPEWKSLPVPKGYCRVENRHTEIITTRHYGYFATCPPSQRCGFNRQSRQICGCRVVYDCELKEWTGWSGSVQQGACGPQSRVGRYNEKYRFDTRIGRPGINLCQGYRHTCGDEFEKRTWCSCRQAQCTLGDWSSWTDMSSPVSHDHCASQQRLRTYTLIWKYIERRDDCNGVLPQSCPADVQETREKPDCAAD
ncbi:uncharacterized protein LOC116620290 [Nematostella vectensis]|uniref:uncharacterized protein LOC116620290 n=1 Tax=Nematostella vectensis TaxID=45351 RepID=UPI0020776A45|nr:uncharacterized protein LOC116620290 [Nematostella vectensis]